MDVRELALAWRRRDEVERLDRADSSRGLEALARLAATELAERYGVRRVVLFGSVARGEATSESDVDLAVEGLAPADLLAAMAVAAERIGRPVDLVRLEEASPSMASRIGDEGVPLLAREVGR